MHRVQLVTVQALNIPLVLFRVELKKKGSRLRNAQSERHLVPMSLYTYAAFASRMSPSGRRRGSSQHPTCSRAATRSRSIVEMPPVLTSTQSFCFFAARSASFSACFTGSPMPSHWWRNHYQFRGQRRQAGRKDGASATIVTCLRSARSKAGQAARRELAGRYNSQARNQPTLPQAISRIPAQVTWSGRVGSSADWTDTTSLC